MELAFWEGNSSENAGQLPAGPASIDPREHPPVGWEDGRRVRVMRVLLAGATGYIGQAVLRELVAQGHEVVALVRPGRRLFLALSDERRNQTPDELSDAVTVVEADITATEDWVASLPNTDVVVSCLASRSLSLIHI